MSSSPTSSFAGSGSVLSQLQRLSESFKGKRRHTQNAQTITRLDTSPYDVLLAFHSTLDGDGLGLAQARPFDCERAGAASALVLRLLSSYTFLLREAGLHERATALSCLVRRLLAASCVLLRPAHGLHGRRDSSSEFEDRYLNASVFHFTSASRVLGLLLLLSGDGDSDAQEEEEEDEGALAREIVRRVRLAKLGNELVAPSLGGDCVHGRPLLEGASERDLVLLEAREPEAAELPLLPFSAFEEEPRVGRDGKKESSVSGPSIATMSAPPRGKELIVEDGETQRVARDPVWSTGRFVPPSRMSAFDVPPHTDDEEDEEEEQEDEEAAFPIHAFTQGYSVDVLLNLPELPALPPTLYAPTVRNGRAAKQQQMVGRHTDASAARATAAFHSGRRETRASALTGTARDEMKAQRAQLYTDVRGLLKARDAPDAVSAQQREFRRRWLATKAAWLCGQETVWERVARATDKDEEEDDDTASEQGAVILRQDTRAQWEEDDVRGLPMRFITEQTYTTFSDVFVNHFTFIYSSERSLAPRALETIVSEADVVRASVAALQGIPSRLYVAVAAAAIDDDDGGDAVRLQAVQCRLISSGVASLASLMSVFAQHGTLYRRLELFADHFMLQAQYGGGLVRQAFAQAVKNYLRIFRDKLSRHASGARTIVELRTRAKFLLFQIRWLAGLCLCCDDDDDGDGVDDDHEEDGEEGEEEEEEEEVGAGAGAGATESRRPEKRVSFSLTVDTPEPRVRDFLRPVLPPSASKPAQSRSPRMQRRKRNGVALEKGSTPAAVAGPSFPKGAELLSYLFECGRDAGSNFHAAPILTYLFKKACLPYLAMLEDWVYQGKLTDPGGEFMVGASAADKGDGDEGEGEGEGGMRFFKRGASFTPTFLAPVADMIFSCGQSLYILRSTDLAYYTCCAAHGTETLGTSARGRSVSAWSMLDEGYSLTDDIIMRLRTIQGLPAVVEPPCRMCFTGAEVERLCRDRAQLRMRQEMMLECVARTLREADDIKELKIAAFRRRWRLEENARQIDLLADAERDVRERREKQLAQKRLLDTQLQEQKERALEDAERERAEAARREQELAEEQERIQALRARIVAEHQRAMEEEARKHAHLDWRAARLDLSSKRTLFLQQLAHRYQEERAAVERGEPPVAANTDEDAEMRQRRTEARRVRLEPGLFGAYKPPEAVENLFAATPQRRPRGSSDAFPGADDEEEEEESMGAGERAAVALAGTLSPPPLFEAEAETDDVVVELLRDDNDDGEDDGFTSAADLEAKEHRHHHHHHQHHHHRNHHRHHHEHKQEDGGDDDDDDDDRRSSDRRQVSSSSSLSSSSSSSVGDGIDSQLDEEAKMVKEGAEDLDETFDAGMFVSVATEKSLIDSIRVQYNMVNKATLHLFFGKLRLKEHLQALRRYFFMYAGDAMTLFTQSLFDGLRAEPPVDWKYPANLRAALSTALRASGYDKDAYAKNLGFLPPSSKTRAKRALDSGRLDCLDHVRMTYATPWPLTLVITDESIKSYDKVFSFFVRVKRVTAELKFMWVQLKSQKQLLQNIARFARRSRQRLGDDGDDQDVDEEEKSALGASPDALRQQMGRLRQVELCRAEMQHVVNTLEGYLITQVLDVSWAEFGDELEGATTLYEVAHLHQKYLWKCIHRCFMGHKSHVVLDIVTSIFKFILQFRAITADVDWSCPVDARTWRAIEKVFSRFREYSVFLHSVLGKLAARGFQHMQHMVLRLDFNGFYARLHAQKEGEDDDGKGSKE